MLNVLTPVVIVKLSQPLEGYNGWGMNQRLPKVGDRGTIIDILKADHLPDKYVVEHESSQPEWLAEFWEDELALLNPSP